MRKIHRIKYVSGKGKKTYCGLKVSSLPKNYVKDYLDGYEFYMRCYRCEAGFDKEMRYYFRNFEKYTESE